MRTTDEIVTEVCSALSVERVEIRPAPARFVECAGCGSPAFLGRCPNACEICGAHPGEGSHPANGVCRRTLPLDSYPDPQPTQQIVRTASFAYYGNDRLDVSHGSSDPIGGWFAPSAETLRIVRCAENAPLKALHQEAVRVLDISYTAEMRVRYGIVPGSESWSTLSERDQIEIRGAISRGVEPVPAAWDALLALQQVTLVCGCTETARCHRVLLAEILVKLGATYAGEIR